MGSRREPLQRRKMSRARVAVAVVGILTPYLARIPGTFSHGSRWLTSYLEGGIGGFLFFGGFNAIAWGTLVGLSYLVRKPSPLIVPSVAGFGFLAYAHSNLDLASDAQAAVALVFIPIYAVPFVLFGFAASVGVLGRGLPPGPKPRSGATSFSVRQLPNDVTASGTTFPCPNCRAVVRHGASHCQQCDERFRYPPVGSK
jgi:hypothetical protein